MRTISVNKLNIPSSSRTMDLFSRFSVVAAAAGIAAARISSHDVINNVSSIFDSLLVL